MDDLGENPLFLDFHPIELPQLGPSWAELWPSASGGPVADADGHQPLGSSLVQ